MTHEPKKYVADMLDACRFVLELVRGKTMQDYKKDRLFRSGLQRELQNVGEALMQLQRNHPEAAAQISERERIIRFRHVLVHGYHDVRADLVWDIVEQKLPILLKELESMTE